MGSAVMQDHVKYMQSAPDMCVCVRACVCVCVRVCVWVKASQSLSLAPSFRCCVVGSCLGRSCTRY